MESRQTGQSAQLVPDPFGGEPRPWWRELFATRPRSKAARSAETLGGLTAFVLGFHGLWGAAVFAALARVPPLGDRAPR